MEDSDAILVERVLAGDEKSFEQLVRRYRRATLLVAQTVVARVEDAEDVCQDAFVQAHRKLGTCRAPDRFGAWLLQIVRNLARNSMRRVRRNPTTGIELAGAAIAPDSPVDDVERMELRHQLLAALSMIPQVEREIVLLHELEDWDHQRISSVLGVSVVMSRRHLSDARRKLRAILFDNHAGGSTND